MNIVNLALSNNISKYNDSLNKRTPEKQTKTDKKTLGCSLIGSSAGILTAVGLIYKNAKKLNPALTLKNLQYSERDILLIGFGSVSGGVLGGSLIDKNNKIPKIREGLMQFLGNLASPLAVLHFANKIFDNSKSFQKIAVTFGSLYLGMQIGNKIMNNVNNKIFDKKENREIHTSDYLVHADDLCIATSLLLKDNKKVTNIISRALPASFILAGVKSGIQKNSIEN